MTASLPNPFLESAPSSSRADTSAAHVDHAAVLSTPASPACAGACQEVGAVAAIGQADAPVATSEEFFPYRFGRKPRAPALSADTLRKLEIALAEIIAFVDGTPAPLFLRDPSPEYLAANNSQIASRSFASNSTFIPTT